MHFKPSFNKYLSFGADRSFKAQGYQYFYAQPVQNLDCQIVILKRLTSPSWWHCLWCWGKERLQCHSVTISAPSARVVAEASWVKKAFNEKGKFNPSSSFLDVSAGEGADVWKPFCIVRTLSYTAPASLPQFPHPAQDPIPVLWVGFCQVKESEWNRQHEGSHLQHSHLLLSKSYMVCIVKPRAKKILSKLAVFHWDQEEKHITIL